MGGRGSAHYTDRMGNDGSDGRVLQASMWAVALAILAMLCCGFYARGRLDGYEEAAKRFDAQSQNYADLARERGMAEGEDCPPGQRDDQAGP
jgi:hypothetical protein